MLLVCYACTVLIFMQGMWWGALLGARGEGAAAVGSGGARRRACTPIVASIVVSLVALALLLLGGRWRATVLGVLGAIFCAQYVVERRCLPYSRHTFLVGARGRALLAASASLLLAAAGGGGVEGGAADDVAPASGSECLARCLVEGLA